MPLDYVAHPLPHDILATHLARDGIRPVPDIVVAAHKQAQLRRFGPGFWYRHQTALGVALLASVVGLAVSAGAANTLLPAASPTVMWIAAGRLVAVALLIFSGVIRVRAGAHWEERFIPADRLDDIGVPTAIARHARALINDLPGATLILGELIQDSAVLDPYLLLDLGGARICLGIWDDDGVIAAAG